MKNNLNQAEKYALDAIQSDASQALLKHILSPMEKAALRRGFQPFYYNLNGIKIYVNGHSSRRLLFIVKHKVCLLTFTVEKERKSIDIPLHLREVFDDPAEILGLPAQTRNRLCAIECYSMYTVMQLGRNFFETWAGFGKRSLSALDALFAKHEVTHLFK